MIHFNEFMLLEPSEDYIYSWINIFIDTLNKHLKWMRNVYESDEDALIHNWETQIIINNPNEEINQFTWSIDYVRRYLINNNRIQMWRYLAKSESICMEILETLKAKKLLVRNETNYIENITEIKKELGDISNYFAINKQETKNKDDSRYKVKIDLKKIIKIVEVLKNNGIDIDDSEFVEMIQNADFNKIYCVPKYKTKTQYIIKRLKAYYIDSDWYDKACKSIGSTTSKVDKCNVNDGNWVELFPI